MVSKLVERWHYNDLGDFFDVHLFGGHRVWFSAEDVLTGINSGMSDECIETQINDFAWQCRALKILKDKRRREMDEMYKLRI